MSHRNRRNRWRRNRDREQNNPQANPDAREVAEENELFQVRENDTDSSENLDIVENSEEGDEDEAEGTEDTTGDDDEETDLDDSDDDDDDDEEEDTSELLDALEEYDSDVFDGEFEGENEMEGEELAFYSLCMKAVEPAATSQSKIRHLHRIAVLYIEESLDFDENSEKKFILNSSKYFVDDHLLNNVVLSTGVIPYLLTMLQQETNPSVLIAVMRVIISIPLNIEGLFDLVADEDEEPVVRKLLDLMNYADNEPHANIIQVYAIACLTVLSESFFGENTIDDLISNVTKIFLDKLRRIESVISDQAQFEPILKSEAGALPLPEEDPEHDEGDASLARLTNEKLQLTAKDMLVLELVGLINFFDMSAEKSTVILPFVTHGGVELLEKLLHYSNDFPVQESELIELISRLSVHRKFNSLFISPQIGGLDALLTLPHNNRNALAHCLYQLVSNTESMEQICLQSSVITMNLFLCLKSLVGMDEDELTHKSVLLAFGFSFSHRSFLEVFDLHNGLNEIFPSLIQFYVEKDPTPIRQKVLHSALFALKEYFCTWLVLKVTDYKIEKGLLGVQPIPSYKAVVHDFDTINACINWLHKEGGVPMNKLPAISFLYQRQPSGALSVGEMVLLIVDSWVLAQVGVDFYPLSRIHHETVEYAYSLLQIATLPLPGKLAFLNAKLSGKSAIYYVMETLRAGFNEPFILCGVCDVLMNLVSISDIGFDGLVPTEKSGRLIAESNFMFESDRHEEAIDHFHDHAADFMEKEVREKEHDLGMDVEEREAKTLVSLAPLPAIAGTPSMPKKITLKHIQMTPVKSTKVAAPPVVNHESQKQSKFSTITELYSQICKSIRNANGISVLVTLLSYITKKKDAEMVRDFSCRVLLGLARDQTLRQILNSKISKILPGLIRHPVDPMNEVWFSHFKRHGLALLKILTGRDTSSVINEKSLSKLERIAVVAQTPIRYSQNQLLQLIHYHLVQQGLDKSATQLLSEAKIAPLHTTEEEDAYDSYYSYSPGGDHDGEENHENHSNFFSNHDHVDNRERDNFATFDRKRNTTGSREATQSMSNSGTQNAHRDRHEGPGKHKFERSEKESESLVLSNDFAHESKMRSFAKTIPNPVIGEIGSVSQNNLTHEAKLEHFTLNDIVEQFLLDQHQKCLHPISLMPEFSLLHEHKCPSSIVTAHKLSHSSPNILNRLMSRSYNPQWGGRHASKLNRKYKYSRFSSKYDLGSIEDQRYTCVHFMDDKVIAGTDAGDIVMFAMKDDAEDPMTHTLSDNSICGISTSPVTMSGPGHRLILAFDWDATFLMDSTQVGIVKKQFNFASSRFSNVSSRFIVGLVRDTYTTVIYDTETCLQLFNLVDPAQNMSKCLPKFSYDDQLILSSGLLWDFRMSRYIHRFDRLSDGGDEQFHPNGCEVFIGSDIWDLKTFKLRTTCPLLTNDLCFNKAGDVVFSLSNPVEKIANEIAPKAGKSFRVIDSVDYELISEITLDYQPIAIDVHRSDDYIAIVEEEDLKDMSSLDQPPIKIWEIGNSNFNRKTDDSSDDEHSHTDLSGLDDLDDEDGHYDQFNFDDELSEVVADGSDDTSTEH